MSVILVTGTSRGIGEAVAVHLEQTDYTVIAQYRTTQSIATKQAAWQCQGDLTVPADVEKIFAEVAHHYNHLDGLVNVVGDFGSYHALPELTVAEFNHVLHSNLDTVQLCIQYALPLLKGSVSGRIINFACAGAEYNLARTYTVPYYIAKSGVVTLTKSWAKWLASDHITVNAIAPGIMEHSQAIPASAKEHIVELPEIVAAVQFLLSPEAKAISGTVLEVSKGWFPA